jgi:uncharacterized protein with PQ loop repeat
MSQQEITIHEISALQFSLGWIGNALAMFFFLSPAFKIYSLYQEKINYSRIAYLQYLCSIVNCLLWFIYGFRRGVMEIWFCNLIGLISNLIYLNVYWYFSLEKNNEKFQQYALNTFGIVFGIFILFMWIFGSLEVAGLCAMLINIIIYASPGQKMVSLMKLNLYLNHF